MKGGRIGDGRIASCLYQYKGTAAGSTAWSWLVNETSESRSARTHTQFACRLAPKARHLISGALCTDIVSSTAYVRFVPNTESPAASLNNFIRRGHQRRRDGEAEGFGGLEVDD
jgi:hypothetical protein